MIANKVLIVRRLKTIKITIAMFDQYFFLIFKLFRLFFQLLFWLLTSNLVCFTYVYLRYKFYLSKSIAGATNLVLK